MLVRSVVHLRKSDGLRGAAVGALADLVMASDLDTFEPGQAIIEAGSRPAGLYLLASGTAQERAANGEAAALVQSGQGRSSKRLRRASRSSRRESRPYGAY